MAAAMTATRWSTPFLSSGFSSAPASRGEEVAHPSAQKGQGRASQSPAPASLAFHGTPAGKLNPLQALTQPFPMHQGPSSDVKDLSTLPAPRGTFLSPKRSDKS